MHNPDNFMADTPVIIEDDPKRSLTPRERKFLTDEFRDAVYASLQGIHSHERARERDAQSIEIVMAKRGTHKTRNIFKAKHLFATHNELVAAASRRVSKEYIGLEGAGVPPAVVVGKIAAGVWLQSGLQERPNIERRQLMLACAKAATSNPEVIERIWRNLKKINESTADQYRALVTQPRYLQMSSDYFKGAPERVDDTNSKELFDKILNEVQREAKSDHLQEQKTLKVAHKTSLNQINAQLKKANDALSEEKKQSRRKFEGVVLPKLHQIRKTSRSYTLMIFFVFVFLCIIPPFLLGGGFVAAAAGIIIMFLVAAFSFHGLSRRTIEDHVRDKQLSRLYVEMKRAGFEQEVNDCEPDLDNCTIKWKGPRLELS